MKKLTLNFEPAFPRAEEQILETFQEITDRTMVSKGLLQAILDNLPINILVFSDKHTISFVNKSFCNLIGYTNIELLDLTLEEFVKLLIIENCYDFTRYPKVLAGETLKNYGCTLKNKTGSPISVNFNSYPLRVQADSHPIGCLCVIEPIA